MSGRKQSKEPWTTLFDRMAKKCPQGDKELIKAVCKILTNRGVIHTVYPHVTPAIIEVRLPTRDPTADPRTDQPLAVRLTLNAKRNLLHFLYKVFSYVKNEDAVFKTVNAFNAGTHYGRSYINEEKENVYLDCSYPGFTVESVNEAQLLDTLASFMANAEYLYKELEQTQK